MVTQIDRIWLWVCYIKSPIYPIFYLLKGDYMWFRISGLSEAHRRAATGLNPKPNKVTTASFLMLDSQLAGGKRFRVMLGLYRENGREHGNYYLGV